MSIIKIINSIVSKRQKVMVKMPTGTESSNGRYKYYPIGFHGDKYLIEFAMSIISKSKYFIETGSNVGSTIAFVAKSTSKVFSYSCEPDKVAYDYAKMNTENLKVEMFNETSQLFLQRIKNQFSNLFSDEVTFWLDAHGYGYEWPLKEEIKFITNHFKKAYIFIDDFKVPNFDCFGYDSYEDQECSYEFIKNSMSTNHSYSIYYPCYTERTSSHHPLRGWCLIEYGHCGVEMIPENLRNKITHIIL